jgi:hypothetical protein
VLYLVACSPVLIFTPALSILGHFLSYGIGHQASGYAADGTIFDYMAGKLNIPYSFAGQCLVLQVSFVSLVLD